ncbi:MAG: DUF1015 domain-containing protein, partial [Lachnospiraceae bacterium]|nr:DUF1015 domain-containing protein [Lachnospiraceae bacterium]
SANGKTGITNIMNSATSKPLVVRIIGRVTSDTKKNATTYEGKYVKINGLSEKAFLGKVSECFEVSQNPEEDKPYAPKAKGEFGMYLDGTWYCLKAKKDILSDDPVEGLDVSVLQNHLLSTILGIGDPKTDHRIDFIGGIRGLKELERRCAEVPGSVAFSMYPTSIGELFSGADAGRLMPPKSTWFEPKLRSGLFLHELG